MSGDFFFQLDIPEPDVNLGAGGGSQAQQTGAIMIGFEQELLTHRPDLVLVVGDVISTMACAITAKKLEIKVAHVEAGIRSGDMSMPEEINCLVTDAICDYFFTTTLEADENLIRNGVPISAVFFVGNTMIDSLLSNLDKLNEPEFFKKQNLKVRDYFLLTLHRPSNVDTEGNLSRMLQLIMENVKKFHVIFPVHPGTRQKLERIGFSNPYLVDVDPLGYHEFIYLVKNAKAIITDSGGITEEATVLGVPCMTMRDSTERPETISIGTNVLIGTNPEALKPYLQMVLEGKWKKGGIPDKWDGKATQRIVDEILNNIIL